MSELNSAEKNALTAQEVQQKYEFYFIGLTFAILALAVQTATFKGPTICPLTELLAWICLLISGLAGLARIEWVPSFLKLHSLRQARETKIEMIRLHGVQSHSGVLDTGTGERMTSSAAIDGLQGAIKDIEEKLKPIQKRIEIKYDLMKFAFILGLVLLLISRGFAVAISIVEELRKTDRWQQLFGF